MNHPTRRPTLSAASQGLRRRPLMGLAGLMVLTALAWPLAARAADDISVVEAVQLPAFLEHEGQRRAAEPGAVLRAGDKAVTASGSRMLLRLSDRSTVRLGEATELLIGTLASEPAGRGNARTIEIGMRLVTGVFRYATDYTSKALGHKTDLNLQMATATVGIRGTDFWTMSDAAHDAVCVFEGHVAVLRTDRPEIALDKPGAFWVTFTGQPEKPAGQATPEQLAKFISQAEMQPGQGVLLQGGRWRLVVAGGATGPQAAALRERLGVQGYPAQVVRRGAGFDVRIDQLATERDAQTVQTRLAALGVNAARIEPVAR